MKRSSWGLPRSDPPPALTKRPYRDAALAHGALAIVIAGLGWATSSHVVRNTVVAIGYFIVATGWTWWRFSVRQRREVEEAEAR